MAEARALRTGDPAVVGPYVLTGLLGEGGQGSVYLAERDGERVALKLLHTRFAEDGDARRRFVRELDAAKRVARFCTAQVLDADLDGDQPYIVSEYVPGVSLQELVTAEGPRTGGALERLAMSTLTALAAIHQAGLVHRDFKPQNVLMGPDGPRVIDFGIARALDATTQSQAIGTPAYMSPEQLNGLPLTGATDLFSWGVSMVFAATGVSPFAAPEIGAILHQIIATQPDLSALPEPLRGVVAGCLAKDAAARPSAAQAQAVLLGSGPLPVPPQAQAGQPNGPLTPRPPAYPAPQVPPPGPVPTYPSAAQPPRQPYPFEVGPSDGKSDALSGRRSALVVAGAVALILTVGVGGWALTRDTDSGKGTLSSGDRTEVTVAPSGGGGGALMGQGDPAETEKPAKDDKTTKPNKEGKDKGGAKPTKGSDDSGTGSGAQESSTPTPAATSSAPAAPAANPYTAAQVCDSAGQGSGYAVQRSAAFNGGTVYQLYSQATEKNCAVTLKTASVGAKSAVWVTLTRQSDGKAVTDKGSYGYYAGPVFLSAPGTCVKIAGGAPGGKTGTAWANCG
ncbi:serine/threonine protein kinase [Actinocorallia herbida]|uniref:Serine/threonine protein kinase n=1 Tax=Actinocorallia herbida TaxID=58109 RepID=A0A3N1D850_9ACTN|nr:serine/threonine-protein kinase [Actinocorallia herbida]ROO89704.1 serine/threonine protein kinase [Actinocorallia herbida]